MKFKYNFLAITLLGTMAVACDPMEDIYDEIDAESTVITKSEEEYVLTKADYEAISGAAKKAATTDAEKKAADDVKKQLALNEIVSGDKYVPALLGKIYPSWGKGSTVGVTYTYRLPYESDRKIDHFRGIKTAYVSGKDYDAIWEEDGFEGAEYFAPKHSAKDNLPALLAGKFADAKQYDKVVVDYKYATENPTVIVGEDLFAEDFSKIASKKPIALEGWSQCQLAGTNNWQGRIFNNDGYAQMSAFRAKGEQKVALITPVVEVTTPDAGLTFDVKYGHYNGDCLTVLVSDNFDGTDYAAATWTDLTKKYKFPKGIADDYTEKVNAGTASLAAFNGKKVQFAFLYTGNGDGVTTTVQVDNVKVTSTKVSHPASCKQSALYQFDGEKWGELADKDVVLVTPADYDAMGTPGKHDNFSDSDKADKYLPQFLAVKFPYAQPNDTKIVVYKFYKNKETKIYTDEYQYNGAWAYKSATQYVTREKETFLHNGKGWLFDPSISYEIVKSDYDYLLNWVKENEPGYLDKKYSDSEYWFGGSAHYGNFNVQLIKRRDNDPKGLMPKDDKEAKVYMTKRIAEGAAMILSKNFPDAPTQMNGVDLYYLFVCKVYDGAGNYRYTFKFKSLGNGKFELEGEPKVANW